MSIRGLTSLIPTFGKSTLGTIRSIADYFAAWSEQDDSGAVAIVDNIAVPGEGILASSAFLGAQELDESGAYGTATAANWTPLANAILTNEPETGGSGIVVLKMEGGTSSNPIGRQTTLIVGERYRAIGWVKSDGDAIPILTDAAVIIWTGVNTHTNRQYFDFEFTAQGTGYSLLATTTLAGQYTEWCNLSLKPTNPFNGDHTGVAVGQPGQYRIGKVATYNGTAYTEKALAAVSEYDAVYNPTNFTRAVVMRKTTWDTTERWPFQDYVDANNFAGIRDTTTAGTIEFVYKAGGTENVVTWVSGSPTDSKLLDLSVSGGVLEGRVNGVSVGTTAIVGAFTGAFTVFMLGAANDTTGGHLGDLAWDQHFTAKTTDADMVRIKNSMGIPA